MPPKKKKIEPKSKKKKHQKLKLHVEKPVSKAAILAKMKEKGLV